MTISAILKMKLLQVYLRGLKTYIMMYI